MLKGICKLNLSGDFFFIEQVEDSKPRRYRVILYPSPSNGSALTRTLNYLTGLHSNTVEYGTGFTKITFL